MFQELSDLRLPSIRFFASRAAYKAATGADAPPPDVSLPKKYWADTQPPFIFGGTRVAYVNAFGLSAEQVLVLSNSDLTEYQRQFYQERGIKMIPLVVPYPVLGYSYTLQQARTVNLPYEEANSNPPVWMDQPECPLPIRNLRATEAWIKPLPGVGWSIVEISNYTASNPPDETARIVRLLEDTNRIVRLLAQQAGLEV